MVRDADDPTGLVGEELNTVAFVMDYVEFQFNGPVLRALTNPIVQATGSLTRFPEAGSRDALCSLIGLEVVAVQIRKDDRIDVVMDGGRVLTIPLDAKSRVGAEALHFVPAAKNGTLRVADMLIW